jgi:hypothetical protein
MVALLLLTDSRPTSGALPKRAKTGSTGYKFRKEKATRRQLLKIKPDNRGSGAHQGASEAEKHDRPSPVNQWQKLARIPLQTFPKFAVEARLM